MMDGILRVSARETTELPATSAKLHLRVEGETFVMGNAVLERSKEVRELVLALKTHGITDEDVQVQSVQARINQGFLAKGTKAVFNLTVHARNMGTISDLLGAVANARHVDLERLEWVYDEDEALLALAAKAMAKAHRKASLMLEAIGYQITGIRAASDSLELPETHDVVLMDSDFMKQEVQRAPARARVDVGTEFKAGKSVAAVASVEFTVGPKVTV